MSQIDILYLRDELKYLPADGLQEGPHNVGLVGVGSQAHYNPPGIPSPVGGQQTPKGRHKVHTFSHKPHSQCLLSSIMLSSTETCAKLMHHAVLHLLQH